MSWITASAIGAMIIRQSTCVRDMSISPLTVPSILWLLIGGIIVPQATAWDTLLRLAMQTRRWKIFLRSPILKHRIPCRWRPLQISVLCARPTCLLRILRRTPMSRLRQRLTPRCCQLLMVCIALIMTFICHVSIKL